MVAILFQPQCLNTLRPRQMTAILQQGIFKCISLYDHWYKVSLKFVPKDPINIKPELVKKWLGAE